jgi:hypothetical protein
LWLASQITAVTSVERLGAHGAGRLHSVDHLPNQIPPPKTATSSSKTELMGAPLRSDRPRWSCCLAEVHPCDAARPIGPQKLPAAGAASIAAIEANDTSSSSNNQEAGQFRKLLRSRMCAFHILHTDIHTKSQRETQELARTCASLSLQFKPAWHEGTEETVRRIEQAVEGVVAAVQHRSKRDMLSRRVSESLSSTN